METDKKAIQRYRDQAVQLYKETTEGKQYISFLANLTLLWIASIVFTAIAGFVIKMVIINAIALTIYIVSMLILLNYLYKFEDRAVEYRKHLEDKEDGNEYKLT